MTIKQQGGIFGRNPTFNDVEIEGTLTTSGALNQSGDFSVDTDTFFVDTTNDRVGVGTNTPSARFESYKSLNGDPKLGHFINDNSGSAAEATIYITNSSATADGLFFQTYGQNGTTAGGFVQDGCSIGSGTGASGGLSIMTRANADMRFYTNGHTNERMRILAGGGITFNGDTAAANALDDYEEGTWTPTDASGAGLTFSVASGTYTKIGDTVTLTMTVQFPANSDSNVIAIGGAPFTAATAAGAGGFVTYTNSSVDMQLYYSGSNIRAYINNGASVQNLSVSGDYIQATLIYRAA